MVEGIEIDSFLPCLSEEFERGVGYRERGIELTYSGSSLTVFTAWRASLRPHDREASKEASGASDTRTRQRSEQHTHEEQERVACG